MSLCRYTKLTTLLLKKSTCLTNASNRKGYSLELITARPAGDVEPKILHPEVFTVPHSLDEIQHKLFIQVSYGDVDIKHRF